MKCIDSVRSCIENTFSSGTDTMLFSSEVFEYIDDLSPLRKIAEAFDARIIMYVRRQDEYLESSYNQHVRMYETRYSGSIDSFAEKHNVFRRFDYNRIADNWAELFGAASIVIRPYGTPFVKSDVTEDILSVVKPELCAELSLKRRKYPSNVSLSAEAMPYLRRLNRLPLNRDQHQQLLHQLRDMFSRTGASRLLSDGEATDFYEKFRTSNEQLFRSYSSFPNIPFDAHNESSDAPTRWVDLEQVDSRRLMDLVAPFNDSDMGR
ncbi:MAG: hypothetical protein QNI86_09980 [Halieaceae bacterium]|nr:hypothetical protein [Halieaceae bacterium]